MSADPRPRPSDDTDVPAQMAGLLLAPLAYLAGLQLAYQLVPHDCRSGSALTGHLIHAATVLVCLAGAGIAWGVWRRHADAGPETAAGSPRRAHFLGVVGLLLSALATLTALAQWLATAFLHPCQ